MSLVIVDDQASLLKYTGLWTGGGTSDHYDHTASASRTAGATMTFPFSGTSVTLIGSYDANTSCTGSFSLDSNSTQFASPVLSSPLNHQTIWASASLPDTQHTLTYTLSSCSSSDAGYVWFDYILYTPSANASTNGVVYFLDDSASNITYAGNWTAETGNNNDFQLTSHRGPQGCSFELDFEGTLVSVYGHVGNDTTDVSTQTSFVLDGSTPVVFSAPVQSSISYNQALFHSDVLEPGSHKLVATSQSGTIWLDYMLVQPNPSVDNTTASSLTQHSSKSPMDIGEIAGVAVGAVVLAVVIALVVIFRRRLFKERRRVPPSRPLSRPPNIHVNDAPTPSGHLPRRLENTTYPPSLSSRSLHTDPFDTPPPSPHARSYVTSSSSSADSQTALISGRALTADAPLTSSIFASSSGHSRRAPSLGGDGDSVAELKRRAAQQHEQPSPIRDANRNSGVPSVTLSHTSSARPLPRPPTAGSTYSQPVPKDSEYPYDDPLDLPPVYTVR